ncbi:unnamed protein product [Trichobilharzia szidati]|nr:unnamed protein product [Trichobilharzia szidati]
MSDKHSMGKAEKRKICDPTVGAWKIMRKMGYEEGQGLGINAQGAVEPVAMSKQKGRSGLGLGSKSDEQQQQQSEAYSPGEIYQSKDPNLVWYEGRDEASADNDLIWTWSIHDKPEVCTVSHLKSILISPSDPEALGPPIKEMSNQDKFCSSKLVGEMLAYKNQLDHLSKTKVTESHERCNPYEMIKKGIFMNRAAMKMANIDSIFNGMFTSAAPRKDILYFADVCAGPGGFSEYTLWRRCNSPYPSIHHSMKKSTHKPVNNTTDKCNNENNPSDDDDSYDCRVETDNVVNVNAEQNILSSGTMAGDTTDDDSDYEDVDGDGRDDDVDAGNVLLGNHKIKKQHQYPLLSAKGFGLTLTGSCDFRLNDFHAGPQEAFMPHYGVTRDGDITKWVNLASFASFIGRSTNGAGVHILMADGGFDVSSQYNLQEVLSKQIYLCQCLCALINLRPGGHFLTKLFDTFTEFTAGLIYVMGHLFEEISIIKPVTSRPANSERYLVCKSLRSPLSTMAGCIPPPAKLSTMTNLNNDNFDQKSNFRQKPRRFPGHQQQVPHTTTTPTTTNTSNHDGQELNRKFGVLTDIEKSGPLGLVIEHFLQVNEALNNNNNKNMNGASINSEIDVLKLCHSGKIESDEQFLEFMHTVNEGIAEHQCIALSKLIAFSHDHNLIEERQIGLHKLCLEKWKVPVTERRQIPWPLLSKNRSDVIHGLLGDKEKFTPLNMLPSDYRPNIRLTPFTKAHLNNLDSLNGSRIALICGNPSLMSTSEPAKSMFIYSRGSGAMDIFCTTDGDQWERLDQVLPRLKPRLPPGTLVWGQPVNEYAVKSGLRKPALFIYDVVCIYGRDCRNLPYKTRMKLAEQMTSIINFPDMDSSNVRVPPLLKLSELGDYKKKLPILPCKDSPVPVPMHRLPDGFTFQPNSVLLVQHMRGTVFASYQLCEQVFIDFRSEYM